MKPTAKKVLVTGASGFLGSHTVKVFADAGYRVFATMRASSDPWRLNLLLQNLPSRVVRTELDLLDASIVRKCLEETRPDVIVHCAAYGVDYAQQDLNEAIRTNVLGTALMIQAAAKAGTERFIHVGTCYEYGDHEGPITEDAPLRPRSIYGSSKAAGSILALERAHAAGLSLAVLRPFGMYGPLDQSSKLIPQILHACLTQSSIELTPGEQIRDYIYVEDVVNSFLLLADLDAFPSGGVFNLGSGRSVLIRTLGETIAKIIGKGGECLKWGAANYRADEIWTIVADPSKARNFLNWDAKTSFGKGITSMLEIQEQNGKKNLCAI